MNKDISREWFEKQKIKAENKRVKSIDNKSNENYKEEINMKNNKMLTVAVDCGKGYTKYYYEKVGENGEVEKITGLERSTVKIKEEASMGGTVYLDDVPHDFTGVTKVVETSNISKNNKEHRALMQNTLLSIAIKEDVADFDVIMCTSLDQFKSKEKVNDMQKFMSIGKFNGKKTIKDKDVNIDINIHNVVIEPEALVATRFAKTKLKKCYAVLVDIGTLNVGIVPLVEGGLDLDTVIAPRIGYHHMLELFKQYVDTKSDNNYALKTLELYIEKYSEKKLEKYKELNDLFEGFFREEYSVLLKNEIQKAGFGEMASLVFLGGTSIRCKALIEENFKEYESVEVIRDIHATVKGAYKKGLKDLQKMKETIMA